MNKILRIFYLLHLIRSENGKNVYPSKKFLIQKLSERFPDDSSGKSARTFERDLEDIRNELFIDIKYNRKHLGYKLDDETYSGSILANTIEAFEVFSSVNLRTGMPDFVIAENRKSNGIEHFHFLVKSILNQDFVRFYYQKFDSEEKKFYEIAPYALKESRHRWYVVGVKKGEKDLQSFGLDRILNLSRTDGKFKPEFSLKEIEQHFSDSFAMFTDGEVEKVVLKFDKRDGNYIKSFPIHHSQQILSEDENSVTLSLKVRITLDFMMELMSRAWSVEVLEPISLRENLREIFKSAVERNG